ncbi:MAG: hypothetical protein LBC92_05400 [Rickettsiales bacterium]|jgi:hypothetical protein|nr:hypothetical protein [Rickettsiales bacterium]
MKTKKIVVFVISAVVLCVGGMFYYVFALNNAEEVKKINENLINDYTREKFISRILDRGGVILYREKIEKHIANNYDKFKNKDDVEKSLSDYIELYNNSFKFLNYFKKISAMNTKDYREIKRNLVNFNFSLVSKKLDFLNTKKNSSDIESVRKYFGAIVMDLDFNYDKAESLYKESININKYNINFYVGYSNFLYNNNKFSEGIILIEKALNGLVVFSQQDSVNNLKLLLNLARFYYLNGNYNKSLEKLNTLLIQSLNYNNDTYKMFAAYNIALLNNKSGSYSDAVNNFIYSFKLSTKLNNTRYALKSLSNLSLASYNLKRYDEGEFYGIKAIVKAEDLEDVIIIADASYNVCLNFNEMEKKEMANIYCELAKKVNNKLKDTIF